MVLTKGRRFDTSPQAPSIEGAWGFRTREGCKTTASLAWMQTGQPTRLLNSRNGGMMTTLTTEVALTSDYAKRHMARSIPGAIWSAEAQAWVLPDPTPRSAAIALRLFPELAITDPWLADLRDQLAQ